MERKEPRTFPVVLRPGEDGWTVAECPLIPGCASQGRTREEAFADVRQAIELCLETEGVPTTEMTEVVVAVRCLPFRS